jgi:hypothetical protein
MSSPILNERKPMAKKLDQTSSRPTHEEIAQRAYAIFEQQGRPPGRELEHWLQAEAQLTGRRSQENGASANPRTMTRTVTHQYQGRS